MCIATHADHCTINNGLLSPSLFREGPITKLGGLRQEDLRVCVCVRVCVCLCVCVCVCEKEEITSRCAVKISPPALHLLTPLP